MKNEYDVWDLNGSRTAGAAPRNVPDNFPKPCQLSDSELWSLILTPRSYGMSQKTLKYLDDVKTEFSKRKIKLAPIMNCKYR